jgi:4-hydroxybenzoate polyprenyltransferase
MLQLDPDCEPLGRGCFGTFLLMIRSGRPFSSVIAGALSLSAVWMHGGFSIRAILMGLAMWVVTMFGFVINDIFDYNKDATAGVIRPIATNSLSRPAALMFSATLLVVAWLLSALVVNGMTVMVLTALALILYTPFAQCLPLLKGLYVAGLCLFPLYYASTVSDVRASWRAYAVLMLFVAGRETLMDADEVEGDRHAGMRTIAVALGRTHARHIGIAMMIAATACLIWVAQGLLGKGLAILSNIMLLSLLRWRNVEEGRRLQLSRVPMLLAALAVASA